MRYITNCALQIRGDRVEKGSEIELSEAEAVAFDPADITAVDAIPEPEEEPAVSDTPLAEMSADQLKAYAKELGLKASGSKADLQERIVLHLEGGSAEEELPEDNQ